MADFKISCTLARQCCAELYGKKVSPQRWYTWRLNAKIPLVRTLTESEFRTLLAIAIIRKDQKFTRFSNVETFSNKLNFYRNSAQVNNIVEQYKQTELKGGFVLAAIVKASGYDRSSVYRLLPGFSCKEKYTVQQMQEMITAIGVK